MPRTAITPVTPKGPFPGTVTAGQLTNAFTVSDVANGNSYVSTGREVIVVRNVNAGAQTFTLTSAPDPQSRTAHITAYSLAAAGFALFYPGTNNPAGWAQSDGTVQLDGAHVDIQWLIIRLP